jgi:chromosome segregation ATPase
MKRIFVAIGNFFAAPFRYAKYKTAYDAVSKAYIEAVKEKDDLNASVNTLRSNFDKTSQDLANANRKIMTFKSDHARLSKSLTDAEFEAYTYENIVHDLEDRIAVLLDDDLAAERENYVLALLHTLPSARRMNKRDVRAIEQAVKFIRSGDYKNPPKFQHIYVADPGPGVALLSADSDPKVVV